MKEFDTAQASRECSQALGAQEYSTVYSVFQQALDSGRPLPGSLLRFFTKAVLQEQGPEAAMAAFEQHADSWSAKSRADVYELVTLDVAFDAVTRGQAHAALTALAHVPRWSNTDRTERAAAITIAARFALDGPAPAIRLFTQAAQGDQDGAQTAVEVFGKTMRALHTLSRAAPQATVAAPAQPKAAAIPHDRMDARHTAVLWTKEQLLRDIPELEQVSGPDHMQPVTCVSFHRHSIRPGTLVIPAIAAGVVAQDPDYTPPDQRAIAQEALFLGASAIITDTPCEGMPPYAPVFRCPDRAAVFKKLASVGRARLAGDVIGVTGSYGKTTTREVTAQMLSFFGPTSSQPVNRNALSGICETLASCPPYGTDCVLELGISRPDTMLENTTVARPDIAMLTTIADAHLEHYPALEALVAEKALIFDGMTGRFPALIGRPALDIDAQLGTRAFARRGLAYLSVGETPSEDIELMAYTMLPYGCAFKVRVLERTVEIILPVAGHHFALSACFALGVAHLKGMDLVQATQALACFRPLEHQRGTRWRISPRRSGITCELIDDSQNAAPDTVLALLDTLKARAPRRSILVLADMEELGEDAPAKHLALAPAIAAAGIDLFVAIGPLARLLAEKLPGPMEVLYFDDASAAQSELPYLLRTGDLIALKGAGRARLGRLRSAIAAPAEQALVRSHWKIEDAFPAQVPQQAAGTAP